MKFSITLFILLFGFASMAQKDYKVCFYPDSISVNNELVEMDTLCSRLSPNGTTRFVFWENDVHKLSVLVKLKDSEEKLKTKWRIEEFRKGKWRKPKLRIRYFHEIIPGGLTRWRSRGTLRHDLRTLGLKTGSPIGRFFEDEEGNLIKVSGYCEFIWVEYKP